MKGADVKAVQKRLKALGYLKTNSQVNGYYGDVTESAVEEFQRRNGLSADGTVGPKTLEKLNSSSAKKAKVTPKPATAKPKVVTAKPGSKTTPKPGSKTTPKTATTKPVDNTKKGVEKLIAIAESKIGCPYSRGAKGPSRFDCSGFVYWCMKQAGFSGGYMTSITWRSCTRYPRINSMSQIQRGDILVFKGNSMDSGHVGIYLGGGKMIDASSGAGQVRITTSVLSGNYWKQHFLMAYRIYN
jgi:cell wall-associated NlpC family hydrolase